MKHAGGSMANFIDRLSAQVTEKRDTLREQYHQGELEISERLRALVEKYWHPPLAKRASGERRPAFAIDGSNRRANLSNGATLFVAQGLILGEDLSETLTDVEILPGTVDAGKLERFADLMRQSLEIRLACDYANQIPPGSVLYLDGALYGTLTQLFPLSDVPRDFAADLQANYRELFERCQSRHISLISIAKTNREPLFSKVLQKYEGIDPVREISDSAFLSLLPGRSAGYVTPLLLGRHSFSDQNAQIILERAGFKTSAAIVSFFIRFGDYEDPLRIDLPAFCVGRQERLGDLDAELIDCALVAPIVQLLMDDYGGLEVYNALAYAVDREVRLTKQKMYGIYLPMIADLLGDEIRLDRSERRFVD